MDAINQISNVDAYRALQPWWDRLAYLTGGLVVFILGISITLQGLRSPSLVCLQSATDNQTFQPNSTEFPQCLNSTMSISMHRFVNSVCIEALDFYDKYFPLILIIYSTVLIITVNLWIMLPGPRNTIETFYTLYKEFKDNPWPLDTWMDIMHDRKEAKEEYEKVRKLITKCIQIGSSTNRQPNANVLYSIHALKYILTVIIVVGIAILNTSLYGLSSIEDVYTCNLSSYFWIPHKLRRRYSCRYENAVSNELLRNLFFLLLVLYLLTALRGIFWLCKDGGNRYSESENQPEVKQMADQEALIPPVRNKKHLNGDTEFLLHWLHRRDDKTAKLLSKLMTDQVEQVLYDGVYPPGKIKVVSSTEDSIELSWDAPSYGPDSKFEVTYFARTSYQLNTHPTMCVVERSCRIKRLKPGTEYCISVKTLNGDKQSTSSRVIVATIPPKPISMRLTQRDETKWKFEFQTTREGEARLKSRIEVIAKKEDGSEENAKHEVTRTDIEIKPFPKYLTSIHCINLINYIDYGDRGDGLKPCNLTSGSLLDSEKCSLAVMPCPGALDRKNTFEIKYGVVEGNTIYGVTWNTMEKHEVDQYVIVCRPIAGGDTCVEIHAHAKKGAVTAKLETLRNVNYDITVYAQIKADIETIVYPEEDGYVVPDDLVKYFEGRTYVAQRVKYPHIQVPSAIHNCEVEYNNNRNAIIHCSLKRVLENMTVRAEFYTPTRKDDYGGHKEGRPNASVMDIEILFDELIYDSDYEAYVVCEIGQTKHGQQIVKFSTKDPRPPVDCKAKFKNTGEWKIEFDTDRNQRDRRFTFDVEIVCTEDETQQPMIYKAKDNEGFVTVPSNNLSPGKSYQAKVYCVQVQDTAQIRSDPTIVDFKTKGISGPKPKLYHVQYKDSRRIVSLLPNASLLEEVQNVFNTAHVPLLLQYYSGEWDDWIDWLDDTKDVPGGCKVRCLPN